MSVEALRWARERATGSATAKLVLLVIAEAADKDGYTWVGQEEIARRAELTARSVLAQMKILEEQGILTRRRRVDKRGWRTSDGLTLAITGNAQHEPSSPWPKANDVQVGSPLTEFDDASNLNVAPLQGERGSPYPLGEPSEEPTRAARSEKRLGRRKSETAIPDGFPGAKDLEDARAKLTAARINLAVESQAERFRDHAITHDRRVRDWPAAFRMWISKAIESAPQAARRPTFSDPPASMEEQPWRKRLSGFKANQFWNTTEWGPKPGKPQCRAPKDILASFGFVPGVVPFPSLDDQEAVA